MDVLLYYIFLGLLQGVTEFLPVSSSGHLVAAQALLSIEEPGILLEVSLHFGTLLSILIVFRRQLWEIARDTWRGCVLLARGNRLTEVAERLPRMVIGIAIVVGTIPAGLAGLFLRDGIEALFQGDPRVTGIFLMITGLVLLASRFAPQGQTDHVGPGRGLLVGVAQAFALLPGVSRSGSTIVSGYYLGIRRSDAAHFSFLLAVPALAGAMVLEGGRAIFGATSGSGSMPATAPLIAGTAAAALMGWLCLVVLLRVVKKGKLHWFAAYCLPAGFALSLYGATVG